MKKDFLQKLGTFMGLYDDEDDYYFEEGNPVKECLNVVSKHKTDFEVAGNSIKILSPTCFEDSTKIADCIIEKNIVIVNLTSLNPIQPVIDFLSGVVYSVKGSIEPIGKNSLAIIPEEIDIDQHTLNLFNEKHMKMKKFFNTKVS